jgi:ATP-dependent Clp endopeptidase proteolytic subunit ClpP
MSPRYLRRVPTAKAERAEITIEGVIGEDVSASDVRKALAKIKGTPELIIHLNSEGGVVTEGMAIHALIKGYKGKKVCVVEGLAASIASVVMCACDEIRMTKGAFAMIHQASAGVEGGADDMEQMASTLRKMNDQIVSIYSERTGKKPEELAKLIDRKDHYMTAEETVALGLADKVATAQAKFDARAVARLNPPDSIRAQIKGQKMDEEEAKALQAKCAKLEEENRALKAKAAKAEADDGKETEEETEEEARAESEEEADEPAHDEDDDEKEEAKAIVALARQLTGKKSSAEIQAALAVRISTGSESPVARASEVADMIRAGKLPPALKAWALKASPKAWSGYRKEMKGRTIVPVGRSHSAPGIKHEPGDAPLGGTSGGGSTKLTAAEKNWQKATGKSDADIIALRGVKPVFAGTSDKDDE